MPAQANSLLDPELQKITRAKWTRDKAQAVECLLYKHETLSSNPFESKNKILL
jgi:hypothetical protein